jgi:hypothetical protein
VWHVGWAAFSKEFSICGGSGFDSHELHHNFKQTNLGATWQPTPGPRGTISFATYMLRVLAVIARFVGKVKIA